MVPLGITTVLVVVLAAGSAAVPTLRQYSVCGFQFYLERDQTVEIKSPFYPYPYPAVGQCQWVVQSPKDTNIRMTCPFLSIMSFDHDCSLDSFYYFPSGRFTPPGDVVPYCGVWQDLDLTTEGNEFAAIFVSQSHYYQNYYYNGFSCTLQVVEKNAPQPPTTTDQPQTTTIKSQTTTSPTTNTCGCGRKGVSRIVGGVVTEANEWPWQASFRIGTYHPFCGASLISHKWLITASHCVESFNKDDIIVTLGEHDHTHNTDTIHSKTYKIKQVIMHENYNPDTVDNDIALIQLTERVVFNEGVNPVCLPFAYENQTFQDQSGIVTGWGTSSFQGPQNQVLHEVTLPIIAIEQCREFYGGAITDNMLCTYTVGRDACQGDSGGPLVWKSGNRYYLVGVVSWGRECAAENKPGVYAKVTNYLSWIQGKVTEDLCH